MKNEAWPTFSFTELLSPPEGWRTDCAILSTYSADLVVVVTSLLALTGCDLDNRRTGSRVELVKAIESLRGKVCILAQTGRMAVPKTFRPILKLMDKFVRTVDANETVSSWHPKASLVRYQSLEDPTDFQWRVWLGSRNLTRALNWEAGLFLVSQSDGNGLRIDGLTAVAEAFFDMANLASRPAKSIAREFANLTWDCPPGCKVQSVRFLGPGLAVGLPQPPPDTERMFIVSPFLDARTVRIASNWGGDKTRRTLVSTSMEIQRLLRDDEKVFGGFDDLRVQPLADLPVEGADILDEEAPATVEVAESEDSPPTGLHAKLFFASNRTRRQLWLGSANATERGWQGRNFEIVAELSIPRETADAIEGFVATCERFKPNITAPKTDEDEDALERARKLLSGGWRLLQRVGRDELEIEASAPPPLLDSTIELQVAVLGGSWNVWPHDAHRVLLPGMPAWQRSDFIQIRVVRGVRMCAWVQVAPCDPPPDDQRDHAIIAQYLDPRTFLWWLRSLLNDDIAHAAGGDWDAEVDTSTSNTVNDSRSVDMGFMPTIEEILRSWARDSSAFVSADEKVKTYLAELERRAGESGATADVDLLKMFRQNWETLALELR